MLRTLLGRAGEMIRLGAYDFGGIVVFYLLLWTLGLKAAIAGTIVFVIVDFFRRRRLGLGFPRIYVLSSALVLVFGAIDLLSANPFMIKYEGVVTNLVLAGMFALGARGASIIEEAVSQRDPEALQGRPELRRFFQLLTLLWAGYFVVKAVVYVWIGSAFPIERALEIRSVVGTVSLLAMVGLMTQGRRLFGLFRALRLLPAEATLGD